MLHDTDSCRVLSYISHDILAYVCYIVITPTSANDWLSSCHTFSLRCDTYVPCRVMLACMFHAGLCSHECHASLHLLPKIWHTVCETTLCAFLYIAERTFLRALAVIVMDILVLLVLILALGAFSLHRCCATQILVCGCIYECMLYVHILAITEMH